MMPESEIQEVLRRLDMLIRLSAYSLIEGKGKWDQFLLLSRVGFQPKDIAAMLGITPNAVRVGLSTLRKRGLTLGGAKQKIREVKL